MTTLRNNFLSKISDLLLANQISNVVYPVRPKIVITICRGAEV